MVEGDADEQWYRTRLKPVRIENLASTYPKRLPSFSHVGQSADMVMRRKSYYMHSIFMMLPDHRQRPDKGGPSAGRQVLSGWPASIDNGGLTGPPRNRSIIILWVWTGLPAWVWTGLPWVWIGLPWVWTGLPAWVWTGLPWVWIGLPWVWTGLPWVWTSEQPGPVIRPYPQSTKSSPNRIW